MRILHCLYRMQAYNHLDVVGPCYNEGSCDTKIPSLYKEICHKRMFVVSAVSHSWQFIDLREVCGAQGCSIES